MEVSIIIPTYNEEEHLPKLLKSIKSQNFNDYEIIIADANSNDSTIAIAENYNCKIVDGGLPGIGRNKGAEIAKGDKLLFLDADLELTENYLENVIDEFETKDVDIGITLMSPLSEKIRDKLLHDIANWFMIAFEKIKPHGAGCYGIITKNKLHKEHGGFDETLNFGEDTDYIERIAKNNTFKVLKSAKVYVSTRRLEEEGLYKLTKQYTKSTINDFRKIRTYLEEIDYSFDHYKPLIEEDDVINHIHNLRKSETNVKQVSNVINKEVSDFQITYDKSNEVSLEDNKRIFYSVCGEGLGHAIRSAVVIEELLKKYDVYVFSSDRAYKYLSEKFDNVYEIGGFNTVYQDNSVKNRKTLYKAIKDTPSHLKENYAILYRKARKLKPNIIITDFENYSNILAKLLNIPILSVDNIHMITKTKVDYPKNSQTEMLKSKGVIKSFMIRPKKYILTSFFYPEVKNPEKVVIYPPIIRDDIIRLKPSYGNYIFVYQTSQTNKKLLNSLKKVDEKFVIYGFNQDKTDSNLTFRKFNETKIYDDMKNCKAIITNGGFSLITEAIYLKKPIYSIPAKGNFEQLLNAFYIEKLGYGMMSRDISTKTIEEFLSNLFVYQENLERVKNSGNTEIIKEIEESIEKFAI
ncbi:MAG: glycosyltransferase [Methanobrevibacter sp. CfCl-M3]